MSGPVRLGRMVPAAFALTPEPEPVCLDARERQDVGATLEVAAGILSRFVHDVAQAGMGLRRGEPDQARQAFRELRRHHSMASKAIDAVGSALDWYGCGHG